MRFRRLRWARAGRTLAALGVVGVLINLLVVWTALAGLRKVDASYDRISVSTVAQRWFQDADMMHDALRADVLAAVLRPELHGDVITDTAGHAQRFRSDLRLVDQAPLPPEIRNLTVILRPLQLDYVSRAERLAREGASGQSIAGPQLAAFLDLFRVLTARQDVVTVALADEVTGSHKKAMDDERQVRIRIILAALLACTGLAVLAYLLHRLGAAYTHMIRQQREAAETLQHGLLPERLPDVVGVQLAARYLAAGTGAEVGGDWYDVIPLPAGKVGLVLGDVAGHDFRAASMMGQFRNVLRAYAAEDLPAAEVLERLNTFTHQQGLEDMATVLYAVLDPVTCSVSVASAGHHPPLLCSPERSTFLRMPVRPPIGAVRDASYVEVVHDFGPDEVLLLYTDGLVERRNESVDAGFERLREAARPAAELELLCDRVLSLVPPDEPHDDVALLAVAPSLTLGDRLELTFPAEATSLMPLRRALSRWLDEAGATDQEAYEILVSVSEAATNAIEHAYGPGPADFQVSCRLDGSTVRIAVRDWGQWRQARGRDRGRGQLLMGGLMDEVALTSADAGTEVMLVRALGRVERPVESPRPIEVHG